MTMRPSRALVACAVLCLLAAPRIAHGQERGAAALDHLVHGLLVTPRVLVIAAHPDDEDTQLIAWLSRGRHVETAYLSLTRGDGGQNLIGNELGEALGAIRTQELLAARRIDGGHQYVGLWGGNTGVSGGGGCNYGSSWIDGYPGDLYNFRCCRNK